MGGVGESGRVDREDLEEGKRVTEGLAGGPRTFRFKFVGLERGGINWPRKRSQKILLDPRVS